MAKMADRNLLTIGALFVIIVVSVLLYVPLGLLTELWMVLATIVALFGCWLMALAVMQRSNPERYGRGAFSYFGWGLLLIAVGGAWFMYAYNWVYSLAVILLALGALAIAAAFRRK
jgi:cobalamin synthase